MAVEHNDFDAVTGWTTVVGDPTKWGIVSIQQPPSPPPPPENYIGFPGPLAAKIVIVGSTVYGPSQFCRVECGPKIGDMTIQVNCVSGANGRPRYGLVFDNGTNWQLVYRGITDATNRTMATFSGLPPQPGNVIEISVEPDGSGNPVVTGVVMDAIGNVLGTGSVTDSTSTKIVGGGRPALGFQWRNGIVTGYPAAIFNSMDAGDL